MCSLTQKSPWMGTLQAGHPAAVGVAPLSAGVTVSSKTYKISKLHCCHYMILYVTMKIYEMILDVTNWDGNSMKWINEHATWWFKRNSTYRSDGPWGGKMRQTLYGIPCRTGSLLGFCVASKSGQWTKSTSFQLCQHERSIKYPEMSGMGI